MPYNANIPLATDLISNSQSDIKTNFTQLNLQFAEDHTAFNTGSGDGDGFHKKITFNVPQGADPSPAGTASQLYTKSVQNQQTMVNYGQPFFKNAEALGLIKPVFAAQTYTIAAGVVTDKHSYNASTVQTDALTKQFTTTFATPGTDAFYYFTINFVTANGASRVTVISQSANTLVYNFQDVGNHNVYPLKVSVMAWNG